jgi:hypothetical protein
MVSYLETIAFNHTSSLDHSVALTGRSYLCNTQQLKLTSFSINKFLLTERVERSC